MISCYFEGSPDAVCLLSVHVCVSVCVRVCARVSGLRQMSAGFCGSVIGAARFPPQTSRTCSVSPRIKTSGAMSDFEEFEKQLSQNRQGESWDQGLKTVVTLLVGDEAQMC